MLNLKRLKGLRFLITFGLIAWVVSLICCKSKSQPEDRFFESESLSHAIGSAISLAQSDNFSFAIVGDLHIGNQDTTRFRKILSMANAEGDSFIILLGDIVDKGEQQDFIAVQNALKENNYEGKFLPVIGNHDIFDEGWNHFRDRLGPSHYTLQFGNSKYIAIDTADGTLGEPQRDWLEAELGKDSPFHIFILSHYLPIIPGERTYLKLSNEEEALALMSLTSERGVRSWLGAHYHSFIVGSVEGVTYVVAGGGGGRRMAPVEAFFFVQVIVKGPSISYQLRTLE